MSSIVLFLFIVLFNLIHALIELYQFEIVFVLAGIGNISKSILSTSQSFFWSVEYSSFFWICCPCSIIPFRI